MSSPTQTSFFSIACVFEASLALIAWIAGWFFGIDPFQSLNFSETALWNGLIATLPLILLFFVIQELPYRRLQQIRQLLLETLGNPLKTLHWSDLLVLAMLAGFGEEVLFRGLMQIGFENKWGIDAGLLISGLLFALAHAVTPVYALLAFLMSLYLGISLDFGGERNLLTPIIIHSFYDFVAFIVIVKQAKVLHMTI